MPFEACADKVNEAHHFLLLMRVAELPPEGDGVPARLQGEAAFRYSFSAFLSAARAVVYFLQEEGAGRPGFTRWYVSARDRWLKDEPAIFFGERRDFRLVFPGGPADLPAMPSALSRHRVGPLPPAAPTGMEIRGHGGQVSFWERPSEPATELCARYLQNLAALVAHAQELCA